jgi:hypothetical protein
MLPAALGETPPVGAIVYSPQGATPVGSTMRAAAIANLEMAQKSLAEVQAMTEQQTAEAQAAFNAALAKSNEDATRVAQVAHGGKPWEVTFTEKR